MNIRIGRLCTFTTISLLSLFGFAAQAGAQGYTFDRLGRSRELQGKTGNTHKAKIASPASGYTYSVLYSFCAESGCPDGYGPMAGLIQRTAGNLYGTTYGGGADNGGTVFKVDSTGQETVLYSFCSRGGDGCTDGFSPYAGLIQGNAANLYGTTYGGGANGIFVGTVFKVNSMGREKVIYSFCSLEKCTDGLAPAAGLIQDAAGNLYGTTQYGGTGNCVAGLDYSGCGTVFKLKGKKETVLYRFKGAPDGANPVSGLVMDEKGNLYGTTSGGGASGYAGTVFKVDATGHEKVLYNFCSEGGGSCTDGYQPSGLIQDAAGNLYGTTYGGGASNGGTVFKVDKKGHETVLYSFCSEGGSNCTDGYSPNGVIQDAAGNLYGTTYGGGANDVNSGYGGGTVFKLDSTGHETVLYNFCSEGGSNCTDGVTPLAGLIQDAAGNLYGTTYGGGANYYYAGTVFSLLRSLPQ